MNDALQSPNPSPRPTVSVVIPNFNSGPLLRACLAAVRASETDGCRVHEIIVVDDASTDGSADCAQEFSAMLHRGDSNLGPAHARNIGASHATSEFLWFLDSDVEVRRDAVEVVTGFIQANPEFVAGDGCYDA